uniref:NADH-ubiquinone oxidoreductase chain 5 n=1 Tax=Philaenus spumarius TaxID=36667 RepID=Q6IT29_PHISP|nr:NADH dehydrogenase subunit 5 [Philaenus spumarius]AAT39438.1 NADH dehydrogenase subunit 5 [Philaenus spumarius]
MNYKINLGFITSLMLILFSLIFFLMFLYFVIHEKLILLEWSIIFLNSSSVYMSIILDWMSLIFMSFVLGISSFVIFYSNEYMIVDKNINRFIYLIILFVASMMFLIISPNLISILLGWDGLGLISYCLVVYYQNNKSYNAGMLTALMNRIGDVALLMSIGWMMNFGGWNYIFYLDKMFNFEFISFMIILAAFTKSAQLPFSSWLPAAMAAPTPVSALVHSSTLVTAGVYLLIRFNLLIMNFFMIDFFLILSLLTMIMSSFGANFEFDLKSIIALSTLSQLGFMMSVLMMGFPSMAFFHLLTHALFKALLFLCAGVVIHSMWGNQDIRFMGGLINQLPIITSCMNISNLALCGFPFLTGFYSKDLIMESMMMSNLNFLSYMLFLLSVGLTVSYSFRLSYYTLSGNLNSFSFLCIYDCSSNMSWSIFIMVFFSIIGGSMLNWLMFSSPVVIMLPLDLKLTTLTMIVMGSLIGYELSMYKNNFFYYFPLLNYFSGMMWFTPLFSTFFFTNHLFKFSLIFSLVINQGWGEYWGPKGLSNLVVNFSKFNQIIQMNSFKFYLMSLIIWILFMFMI